MFGYLQPRWPELRMREAHGYRAHYCGLCHTLKERFGRLGALTLSYDATLLALTAALYLPPADARKKACLVNPFQRILIQQGAASDHAANANILYAYHKCRDDAADEGSLRGKVGARLLARPMKKAAAQCPAMAGEIEEHLRVLARWEAEGCDEMDLPAGESGRALAAAFTHIPGAEREADVLRWMGYHLGRWIYLCDAYDDLESDAKNSSYNVLLRRYGDVAVVRAQTEVIGFNLHYSLRQAGQALELLKPGEYTPILHNIIMEQGTALTEQLLATGSSRPPGEKNKRRGLPAL